MDELAFDDLMVPASLVTLRCRRDPWTTHECSVKRLFSEFARPSDESGKSVGKSTSSCNSIQRKREIVDER